MKNLNLKALEKLSPQQNTLRSAVHLQGIGVHNGKPAAITIHPASAHHGLVFKVKQNGREVLIPAHFSRVAALNNATALGAEDGTTLCTIEHVMSTLTALQVDNALIVVEGEEVPVFDGSACPIVRAIDEVGLKAQTAPRRFLRILKTVEVENGLSKASLAPCNSGFDIDVTIDFKAPIGKSRFHGLLSPALFRKEIARARTFGFLEEHQALVNQGLALGSTLENTVVFDGNRVLNDGGLRYVDEMVRHKWLDAVGDLALAGAPILGAYTSYRGGHRLNIMMLQKLFEDPSSYDYVSFATPSQKLSKNLFNSSLQPSYL